MLTAHVYGHLQLFLFLLLSLLIAVLQLSGVLICSVRTWIGLLTNSKTALAPRYLAYLRKISLSNHLRGFFTDWCHSLC